MLSVRLPVNTELLVVKSGGSQVMWGFLTVWGVKESESGSCSVVSDSLWFHGLYSPWNSPGQNAAVGSFSLVQGIFPTQGSNLGHPHCWWILYQLSHKGNPRILEWVAYPFSSGSSWPRNQTRASCTAGRLFTNWALRKALWVGWAPLILQGVQRSTLYVTQTHSRYTDV